MSYLQYDTEKMLNVKNKYKLYVDQMDSIQKEMKKMVEDVREGWKSEAGDAFFEKYNNEWLKGFEQYKQVIEHMAGNLDMASGRYTEITQQVQSLDIKK